MKNKPALWTVIGLPLLFLLLLAGSVRGLSYLKNPSGEGEAAQAAPPEDFAPARPMEAADAKTAAEIKKVAGGQIAALQKRNYKEALHFAQPDFQKQMTPLMFGQMIESSYSELTTAKNVTLDAPKVSPGGESAFVSVVVRNAQNKETHFLYVLNRDAPPATKSGDKTSDGKATVGTWRVSSCVRVPTAPMPPPVRALHEA